MIKVLAAVAALAFISAAFLFVRVQNLLAPLGSASAETDSSLCEYSPMDALEERIPRPEDWIDFGPILEAGVEGEWDYNWGDFAPAVIVKKDGLYYAYYIGSDGYRSFDGGHRHRSIGVAVSADGVRYEKYNGNPIVTHAPRNGEEEGANSVAVTLDAEGNFVMFYGGAVGPRDIINADGRLAISTDGYAFTDRGIVLHHLNPFVYGFGDELFPVAAFQYDKNWYVFYQPNGAMNERTLGVAWGSRANRLLRTSAVLDETSGGKPVGSWGNVNWLGENKIVFFIQRLWWPDAYLEVRTAHPDNPQRLSDPVVCYQIPNLQRGTAFLDAERNTWFMIYTDFGRFWNLKLAPAGEPDQTPPGSPDGLAVEPIDHANLRLTWKPAEDPDSGVAAYRIYRDGVLIGQTIQLDFYDTGLMELSAYTYKVRAVNFHGYEGEAAKLEVLTPADLSAPRLVSAATDGIPTQLLVSFDETLERKSAELAHNYRISPDVRVQKAVLLPDQRTVRLTTSNQAENRIYTLKISGIADTAKSPNRITHQTSHVYAHIGVPGQVGYWSTQFSSTGQLLDLSGFGNHGSAHNVEQGESKQQTGLYFNGVDSFISIEDNPPLGTLTNSSFSFSAWIKPEQPPPVSNPHAILVRSDVHPLYAAGLALTSEGNAAAQLVGADDEYYRIRSMVLSAGEWHHVAMVFDAERRQMHLYIDGIEVQASPLSIEDKLYDFNHDKAGQDPAGVYYIGSSRPDRGMGGSFDQYFHGFIDEVRMFSRALTTDEIVLIYLLDHEKSDLLSLNQQ